MERRRLTFLSVMLCATGCVLMPGCQPQKKAETAPQICTVSTDTIVRLQEGEKVPTCKINLDFSYLQPASESDSSTQINATIIRTVFGSSYETLQPDKVLPALAESYIKNYKTDVKGLFEADLHNGMKPDDVPAWYNYEYQLNTEMKEGKKGVWNYTVTPIHRRRTSQYHNHLPEHQSGNRENLERRRCVQRKRHGKHLQAHHERTHQGSEPTDGYRYHYFPRRIAIYRHPAGYLPVYPV